jgi:serine/threonine protein kinase
MERLGGDLRRIRDSMNEPLFIETIVAIGLRMLKTLTSLHRTGWAHGDAHPENWLTPIDSGDLFKPATLQLTDFGWELPLTPALKLHDLRMIAMIMRYAQVGGWLFEFPFGCPISERVGYSTRRTL